MNLRKDHYRVLASRATSLACERTTQHTFGQRVHGRPGVKTRRRRRTSTRLKYRGVPGPAGRLLPVGGSGMRSERNVVVYCAFSVRLHCDGSKNERTNDCLRRRRRRPACLFFSFHIKLPLIYRRQLGRSVGHSAESTTTTTSSSRTSL